jgi:hypothetical protein
LDGEEFIFASPNPEENIPVKRKSTIDVLDDELTEDGIFMKRNFFTI